ncbi:hypothetical protein DL93DRAFT_294230 [Clavulina sp. PMI_390]|nr:hypothetical protein DL93DRAFT_294230 [Clavulina sp. PMI_390]
MRLGDLPTELLLGVFGLVLEPSGLHKTTSFDVITSLAAVNRSWKAIIASSHQLWGKITVTYPDHLRADFERRNRGLEICLARSANCALSLHFNFGKSGADTASLVVAILHAASAFHRCYSLVVQALFEQDLNSFLPLSSNLSHLRVLGLSFMIFTAIGKGRFIEPPDGPHCDQSSEPKLRLSELTLEGCCALRFDPTKEKHLSVDRLRGITLTTIEERLHVTMRFLETCPVLETLTITIYCEEQSKIRARPFLLPSLATLIVAEDAGVSFRFMRIITAPNLRALRYTCFRESPFESDLEKARWLDVEKAQPEDIPLFPRLHLVLLARVPRGLLETRVLPFLHKNASTEILELEQTPLIRLIIQSLMGVNANSRCQGKGDYFQVRSLVLVRIRLLMCALYFLGLLVPGNISHPS